MNRKMILRSLLEKLTENIAFYALFINNPQTALKDIKGLDLNDKAALLYGDVLFIESRIGKLTEEMLTKVMIPLLSRTKHPDDKDTTVLTWCRR